MVVDRVEPSDIDIEATSTWRGRVRTGDADDGVAVVVDAVIRPCLPSWIGDPS